MLKQNSFGIKVLSLVLSVLMTISALPLSVFAIESTDGNTEEIADNLNLVKDVVEIKELRDENVKHFRLEDGSYMAAQYEVPVHYLDENGDWQDIDNSLTESGSEISTKNAKIKFAKKITGNGTLLTIHESNHKITMSLEQTWQIVLSIAVSAIVSAMTIGGKAFMKKIAISNSKDFVMFVARVLAIFNKDERKIRKKQKESKTQEHKDELKEDKKSK